VEPFVFIFVVLAVALLAGGLAVTTRGPGTWGGRILRSRSRLAPIGNLKGGVARLPKTPSDSGDLVVTATPVDDTPRTARLPANPPTVPVTRVVHEPQVQAVLSERLDRLEERTKTIERQLDRLLEVVRDEMRLGRDSVESTVASAEARQMTALERLRSDLAGRTFGVDSAAAVDMVRERRAEAVAGMYAGIARFESALAQVTNPILLPGEAYAPPPDFLPEALAWENWKDVGERAFSLADAFSSQRLYFSDPTRQELSAFVTTLRGVLTRTIYPNLVPDPTPDQLDALRGALGSLATELPRVRRALEAEFRSLAGGAPSSSEATERSG